MKLLLIFTMAYSHTFTYNNNLKIKVNENNYEKAYKIATKKCYSILTKNKYPGEEKGLEIIDICANPRK